MFGIVDGFRLISVFNSSYLAQVASGYIVFDHTIKL